MNRPNILSYLIGNLPVISVLVIATPYTAYLWWTGNMNLLVPLFLAGVARYALTARGHVVRFRRWNREWNAINDGGAVAGSRRFTALRLIVGALLWVCIAYYVARHGDEASMRLPASVFWLASVVLFASPLLRMALRAAQSRPRRAAAVKVCAPRAWHSPTATQAYAALPDYCAGLMTSTSSERD